MVKVKEQRPYLFTKTML